MRRQRRKHASARRGRTDGREGRASTGAACQETRRVRLPGTMVKIMWILRALGLFGFRNRRFVRHASNGSVGQ
jgi:hypothetical protein